MSTEPNRRGFHNLPIATKLNIVLASSLILLFMIGILSLSSWLTRTLEQQHIDTLGKTNGVILSLINAYSESLEKSVQQQAASLGLQFDGSFALEAGSRWRLPVWPRHC